MATMTLRTDDGTSGQVELTDDQALALAQLCKRITFNDCRENAVSNDEAYLMIDATNVVGRALANVGYVPR